MGAILVGATIADWLHCDLGPDRARHPLRPDDAADRSRAAQCRPAAPHPRSGGGDARDQRIHRRVGAADGPYRPGELVAAVAGTGMLRDKLITVRLDLLAARRLRRRAAPPHAARHRHRAKAAALSRPHPIPDEAIELHSATARAFFLVGRARRLSIAAPVGRTRGDHSKPFRAMGRHRCRRMVMHRLNAPVAIGSCL